jgi:hypothetical protein
MSGRRPTQPGVCRTGMARRHGANWVWLRWTGGHKWKPSGSTLLISMVRAAPGLCLADNHLRCLWESAMWRSPSLNLLSTCFALEEDVGDAKRDVSSTDTSLDRACGGLYHATVRSVWPLDMRTWLSSWDSCTTLDSVAVGPLWRPVEPRPSLDSAPSLCVARRHTLRGSPPLDACAVLDFVQARFCAAEASGRRFCLRPLRDVRRPRRPAT